MNMENRRVTRSMRKQVRISGGSVTFTSQYQVTTQARATVRPPRNRAQGTVKTTLTRTTTISRAHAARAGLRFGVLTVLPLTVPGAKGFVFANGSKSVRNAMFRLHKTQTLRFRDRDIPSVLVQAAFGIPDDAFIYHAFITVGERTFLVYGYHIEANASNALILSLDATLQWRGDIVVFEVGRVRPLLRSPTICRDTLNVVALGFARRVEPYLV